jgi:ADP-ribose pyrophosphatase YjhB (NUDIX family)
MTQENPPVFHNRQSQCVFISRSVAVLVVPIYKCNSLHWVPLGLRSNAVSEAGQWCLPCGYLDWDESGRDAAIREAYEEIGIDLTGKLPSQPWFVQSDPGKDSRQNVTLRFGAVIDLDAIANEFEDGTPRLPDLKASTEVQQVQWATIYAAMNDIDLAFNQSEILGDFALKAGVLKV